MELGTQPPPPNQVTSTVAGPKLSDHSEAASSNVQHERPPPDSAPDSKKLKLNKDNDVKSFKLTPGQHELLVRLESTFPDWPTRRSTEPAELRHKVKWKAIEAEMKANFPELEVNKRSMVNTCAYWKKCCELKTLRRWREDNSIDKRAENARLAGSVGPAQLQQDLAAFFADATELAHQREQDEVERESLVRKVDDLEKKADTLSEGRQTALLLRGEYETQVLSLQNRVCLLESQAQQMEEFVADLEKEQRNGKEKMKFLLAQLKGAMAENFKLVEAVVKPLK